MSIDRSMKYCVTEYNLLARLGDKDCSMPNWENEIEELIELELFFAER